VCGRVASTANGSLSWSPGQLPSGKMVEGEGGRGGGIGRPVSVGLLLQGCCRGMHEKIQAETRQGPKQHQQKDRRHSALSR
jgi:hypothetical protein